MVRVLVIGATGYIGRAVALALRKHSHIVYGLARDDAKGRLLAQKEIIPVIGSVEGGEYLRTVESANIDVVIDASGVFDASWKILERLKTISAARLQSRGMITPKLGFVYTSGTWIHGSSTRDRLNDLNPVGVEGDSGCPVSPPDLVSWRPRLEADILASKEVLGIAIVRPGLVYGNEASTWSLWFSRIAQAQAEGASSVELEADSDAILSLIHVNELAEAYVKVASQISKLSNGGVYPVFDVVGSRENLGSILKEVAKAMGFQGDLRIVPAQDAFHVAMSTGVRLDSTRLRDLLGWECKRAFGFLDEVEVLTAAWQAGAQ
jgi:nucleoside-diphosphate-sugar epimerase